MSTLNRCKQTLGGMPHPTAGLDEVRILLPPFLPPEEKARAISSENPDGPYKYYGNIASKDSSCQLTMRIASWNIQSHWNSLRKNVLVIIQAQHYP